MFSKNIVLYVIISYVWSYLFWILAIVLATTTNQEVLLNESFIKEIITGELTQEMWLFALLAVIAVYGPLVATLVVAQRNHETRKHIKQRIIFSKNPRMYMSVIGIFLAIGLVPSLPLLITSGMSDTSVYTASLILITFFVYQLLTSGMEEIGWRGYLLPELLKTNDGWTASLKVGIVWAIWHLPIVLYIFHLQGMPVFAMLFSFVGFSMGIIAMSVLHTYFFVKTKSALFSIFLHAIGNTIPLVSGLFIANAYQVAVISQLLIWVVVAIIMKKHKEIYSSNEVVND